MIMKTPILMYHEVESGIATAKRYSVTTAQFEQQLDWLRAQEYRTCLLPTALRPPADSSRRVALTFDDSHAVHCINSFPRLLDRNQVATYFVVTAHIDQGQGLLTRTNLREMHRAGMAIESHSHTHPYLDNIPIREVRRELAQSKTCLEDWLGAKVRYLSCPGGRYNTTVLHIAAEVGYEAVFTSRPGTLASSSLSTRLEGLPRLIVTSNTSPAEFAKIVTADSTHLRKIAVKYCIKSAARKMLGGALYYSVWKRFAGAN
jgi:peptidoglycan/xylan/chitin deacetylase (PgdA/CDA1 family)